MAKPMRVCLGALAIFAVGCGEQDGNQEEVVQIQEPLTYTDTTWTKGQGELDLGSSSGRFCFLSRIQGDFDGGGEMVRVFISGGRWKIHGTSGTSHTISATARCKALDSGKSYTAESAQWDKGEATKNLSSALGVGNGDSCFLTKVCGNFNGGGEQVRTWKDGSGNWWLGGASQTSGGLCARARCLNGEALITLNNGDTVGYWLEDNPAIVLRFAPSSSSIACFLQGMRGKFQGGGEYITTYYDSVEAAFKLGGGSGQFGVSTWAGCMQ